MTIISLEQRYAGHAAQVLALAAQVPGGAYYTKWIVAVDEDIDPENADALFWAMSYRCQPQHDLKLLPHKKIACGNFISKQPIFTSGKIPDNAAGFLHN